MKYRFLFWTFEIFFFFEKRPFMARQFYYTLPFSAAICSSTMYDYTYMGSSSYTIFELIESPRSSKVAKYIGKPATR